VILAWVGLAMIGVPCLLMIGSAAVLAIRDGNGLVVAAIVYFVVAVLLVTYGSTLR